MAIKTAKALKTIDTRDKKNRKLTRKDVQAAAKKYKNWGRWGKDDEIGTLNFTTAEHIVAAAKLVRVLNNQLHALADVDDRCDALEARLAALPAAAAAQR